MTDTAETEALSIMRTLYNLTDTQPMRWFVIDSVSDQDTTEAGLQLAVDKGWLYLRRGNMKRERRVYLTLIGRRVVEDRLDDWIRRPVDWRGQEPA